MAGSLLSDLEPDERDLPFTALARQLGAWVPPDLNSSELPFAALARSVGVTPLAAAQPGKVAQAQPDAGAGTNAPSADDAAQPDILRYPNGSPAIDFNTDKPFPRPAPLDMEQNLNVAELINYRRTHPMPGIWDPTFSFGLMFPAGASRDYQRPHGWLAAKLFGDFRPEYTNVTAYNFGAMGAAAGFDLEELLNGAAVYNRLRGEMRGVNPLFGLTDERVNSIAQGFSDYYNKRWKK